MLDEMRVNDEQLDSSDIRQLENADEIERFFAKLRYDVSIRRTIPLDATAYANTQDLKMQIRHHELIATDTADEDIRIYLFEVRSVTAKLRNELARGFLKTNDAKVLLVLTADYEDIEFVYLERSDPQKTKRKGLSLKITIRPIPLTVNRLKPDSVALRVLKRFTFTEEDSDYQWEKLRSAYMLAEWSEEYFNNRALFSDYYLKERLTDARITPEWSEDVRPIGRDVFQHLTSARKNYTRQTEDVIRKGLFEPTFKLLGFDFAEKKPGSSSAEEADYLLYAPDNKEQPIAAALTYVWNRNLDDVDESRELEEDKGGTPFEIPGAMVVSLLEAQVAPWVIVTNGKLWRLYSSTASNKATNYYEIDLEEAIAANDQITALKYWWLMFRREAFTGFLDELLKNSADYAKELGDRLKDRVFVEIFPQFAKGFIADMRAQGVQEADIDLDTVFSGTMTFLYRLMFTLYAESLELVPINEVQGYRELSMYRMKDDIKNKADVVTDKNKSLDARERATNNLIVAYKATNTELYSRLNQLFTVIDEGSDELNMPTYNGGLFSQETDSGEFLASYGIPDRFLALGLDRLTRDIDTKTQALAFIDFKSLGVRQLGSIYEGLLEFKLKIATEALAVTKEKGKEVYQPAKKVKKPLATLAKGEVYLENDKQERKATGSYYTPDYIVKYIVRHTVGPVLDRKFAELEKRLRYAKKGYDDYADLVKARRKSSGKEESPAVYWNNPEMQNLVDDCLNVRVLDPAMGSGHFLVEVVDYTSNRLIDFLNGWTENPIWNFIDQTRQDILDDMERQHVSIDSDRLTRVSLLKRAVLKRCIYGVDLNQMAVELAKVSLWLDAFTLGAPLSFLDHHLKHGNSLIGARVAEVQEALKGQQTLFSQNKFAGVMLATDLMRQVSYLSDNTIEQTRKSAQAYRDARDHLAPYKRVLDVYTSRWFGNAPIAGKRGNQGTDITIDFLQRNDTQAWLEDPRKPENRLPADDYMKAGLIAKTALNAAEEKRFFHWELEFPEVFFAPSKPGGQDVQLKQDGGFDAVVGNPPYGIVNDRVTTEYMQSSFAHDGLTEMYIYFFEAGLALLSAESYLSFINPNTWLQIFSGSEFRIHLITNFRVAEIVHFSESVFDDATVDTEITIVQKVNPTENVMSISLQGIEAKRHLLPQDYWIQKDGDIISITHTKELIDLFEKIEHRSISLNEIGQAKNGVKPFEVGKGKPPQTKEILRDKPFVQSYKKDDTFVPLLRGSLIDRYSNFWNNDSYISYGEWLAAPRDASIFFDIPAKIALRQTGDMLVGTVVDDTYVCRDNMHLIIVSDENYDIDYVCAIFNSNLQNHYYQNMNPEEGEVFAQVKLSHVERLPIPRIDFTTPTDERERLTQQITGAYSIGDNAGVLKRVQAVLGANQTDVVHDVLAHLAQRMIDLNKAKQAEVGRFLAWLESKLRIQPKNDGSTGIDSLTGKTVIQGYLGDYQKGDGELSWEDFLYRLHQNRNRFAVPLSDVEGEIQIEFEKSLATLIPMKRDLARTDALIDKIVYRLYGLTDAEIELIERPQYEQALTDAKATVRANKELTEDADAAFEYVASRIEPPAARLTDIAPSPTAVQALQAELVTWDQFPERVQSLLIQAERDLQDHGRIDYTGSAINYAKAVEIVLIDTLFVPFRDAGHTEHDVKNSQAFKPFMARKRHLTLGNLPFVFTSDEKAFRQFVATIYPDAEKRVFDKQAGIRSYLTEENIKRRNGVAHTEIVDRDTAVEARAWALGILGMV